MVQQRISFGKNDFCLVEASHDQPCLPKGQKRPAEPMRVTQAPIQVGRLFRRRRCLGRCSGAQYRTQCVPESRLLMLRRVLCDVRDRVLKSSDTFGNERQRVPQPRRGTAQGNTDRTITARAEGPFERSANFVEFAHV